VAASKINIPIAHIEAGLRSFNKAMPEEINRILCDHCSTLLFSPTETGFKNLVQEGFNPENQPLFTADNPRIYHCGDVMYDNSLHFAELAMQQSQVLKNNQLIADQYILCTIHRNNNTDEPERLQQIFESLLEIVKQSGKRIALPLHPRTAKLLKTNLSPECYQDVISNPLVHLMEPVSFLDMIALEQNASYIITDSGGVQKEAYFFKKPCIILRPETEWKEIVEVGAAQIADASKTKILNAWNRFMEVPPMDFPLIFGDGQAARFIAEELISQS
jgi:UDP-GlcNAc3NAcA epimerase